MMSKADITHHLLPKKGIVETFVVEDAENPGKLSDFMSFLYFYQQCLTKEELGHNHDLEIDATLYYYSFTKNSYENMIKMAMWLAKEDLGADSLCINSQQEHDPEQLQKEFKFMPDATPFYYYLLNWSFGDRKVDPKDMGVIMI